MLLGDVHVQPQAVHLICFLTHNCCKNGEECIVTMTRCSF